MISIFNPQGHSLSPAVAGLVFVWYCYARFVMQIKTKRVVIRDFVPSDAPAFLAYHADPRSGLLLRLDKTTSSPLPCDHRLRRSSAVSVCDARAITRRSRAWHRARPRLLERLCLRCGDWARDSHFGFDTLGLHTIVGSTFSSNSAVARLAEWFGAEIVATRRGPEWMSLARWRNVDWRSTRQQWQRQTSKTHRISGASS